MQEESYHQAICRLQELSSDGCLGVETRKVGIASAVGLCDWKEMVSLWLKASVTAGSGSCPFQNTLTFISQLKKSRKSSVSLDNGTVDLYQLQEPIWFR
jgi:hypothetical protein